MAAHSSILAWSIPMDRGGWQAAVHRVAESDMTERLSKRSPLDGGWGSDTARRGKLHVGVICPGLLHYGKQVTG